jgi:hypothetical protein
MMIFEGLVFRVVGQVSILKTVIPEVDQPGDHSFAIVLNF